MMEYEYGITYRVLADDMRIIADGPDHISKFENALNATRKHLDDIGRIVAIENTFSPTTTMPTFGTQRTFGHTSVTQFALPQTPGTLEQTLRQVYTSTLLLFTIDSTTLHRQCTDYSDFQYSTNSKLTPSAPMAMHKHCTGVKRPARLKVSLANTQPVYLTTYFLNIATDQQTLHTNLHQVGTTPTHGRILWLEGLLC